MPTLSIEGFTGRIPRSGPSRIGADNATVALNVKLQSGELRPWRLPVSVITSTISNVQGIYQLLGPSSSVWLEWPYDVDVVGAPMADNGDYRVYFTGAGCAPSKTNWSLATTGTGNFPIKTVPMGVPAPTASPALSPSSTAGPNVTDSYVYTFVNQFGSVQEESAPSPAGTVTVLSTGTVTISGFSYGDLTTAAGYNPVAVNIYRTVAGSSSVSYQFVAQIAWNTTSFVDNLSTTTLGQALPSTYWAPPPAAMTGLVEMPNGMLAGFVGNQVWFCEPYHPHAWPVTYMLTVEYPVVGLGVFGNSLFVGTTKNPYLITGTTPSAMSQEKLPIIQACVSKRSIQSDQWGVIYASPNGLLAVGPGVQDVVTQNLYTRDEWQLLNPSSIIGLLYNNQYMGFYTDANGMQKAFVFTRNDTPPLTDFDFKANAVYMSRQTNNVYALSADDNKIYQLDADQQHNTVYQWQSRMYIMPEPTNYAALKMQADWPNVSPPAPPSTIQLTPIPGTDVLAACLNDTPINTYAVDGDLQKVIPRSVAAGFVQVTVYGDGSQLFQTPLYNDEPIRMPASRKCRTYQVLISGNVSVRKFSMATTIGELKQT